MIEIKEYNDIIISQKQELSCEARGEKFMKNIVLLCSAGMSTSMLVTRMKKAADEIAYECDINAY